MANSNFVVHNGLTVGPTTIDAASGNITIPVGKQITIGNILLRDNGNGQLAVRDITDNSDAIVNATLDSGTQTLGNIQLGTNHIESINANGPISLRPNGAGNIALAANTVMLGKGGAYTLISTGEQTDATLGINYAPSNIIVQTTGALSSGNVRVSMTTPSTSTATGAFQVMGGIGAVGTAFAGHFNTAGNILSTGAIHNSLTVNGQINSSIIAVGNILVGGTGGGFNSNVTVYATGFNSAGNILATGGVLNSLTVNGGITSTGFFNTSANISAAIVLGGTMTTTGTLTAGQINTAGNILATGGVLNSLTVNGTTNSRDVIPITSNTYNLGSTTNWFSKAFTVSATAQYADLAENYLGDTGYAAGTVVDFGGTYEITLCDSDMSPRVAGVVSTNPAYLMNGTQTGENIVAVALTGRVPTRVRGPIRKGDLIVSAGDGHARAETLPQVGTVIGKALEDFDGDSGVIEVVVGKH